VFCQVGLRGYLACRILSQNGYKCRNLTGGYKTYLMSTQVDSTLPEKKEEMKDDSGERSQKTAPAKIDIKKEVDARGLQCPGPIMQLKAAIDDIKTGEAVSIIVSDPAFITDAPAWCHATGHELSGIEPRADGGYMATIIKRTGTSCLAAAAKAKTMTNVIFSNDFDKAMAAFIIANGAASMGYAVTIFFTFWGINILRKDETVNVKKNLIEKMFGWMMPKGPEKLALSQMQMGGMGSWLIKSIMRKKHVSTLSDLIISARKSGVRLVVCTMSMDLMGIKKQELIEGIEEGGVAMFVDNLPATGASLFI